MKTFIIRDGFTFILPCGTLKIGGDKIDLEDDVAQQHLHKLEAQPEPEPKAPKKAPASKTAVIETIAAADVGDLGTVLGVDTGAAASTDPA